MVIYISIQDYGIYKEDGIDFVANYDKDTRTMKLFLDGEKISEEIGDINTQPSTLTIGKSFGYLFSGQVGNVRLYNISVEENIIKEIYENEK